MQPFVIEIVIPDIKIRLKLYFRLLKRNVYSESDNRFLKVIYYYFVIFTFDSILCNGMWYIYSYNYLTVNIHISLNNKLVQ